MNPREAAALLKSWDHILILTHKRPDGDTLGCAAGLCAALRAIGKTAFVLPALDAIPLLAALVDDLLAPGDFVPDYVVSVDVASVGLFPDNAKPWLDRGVDLAIDHHASNAGFGAINYVDPSAAACGEIVFAIAQELLGQLLPAQITYPLYVAVATDTGCFVYPNTSPNTHHVAAELVASGIDFAGANKAHFRTKSFKRLQLEGRLTESMEFHDGGHIVLASIPLSLLRELGATEADTDNISAFAGQVEGVDTAVTLREYPGGEIRVSVRTSGGLDASQVCTLLGGGGHAGAAGATFHGPMDQAKAAVLDAIRQVQNG